MLLQNWQFNVRLIFVDVCQNTSILVSIFAFAINAKKWESTLEAVETATFIAHRTPNKSVLVVAKCIAQKAQMCIMTACWKCQQIHLFQNL